MTRNRRRQVAPGPRVLDHLMADRKKAALAAGLVAIMVIMWVRMLTGKKPGAAGAAPEQPPAAQSTQTPPVKLRFVELPVIEGRHDRIRRDFFSADTRAGFRRDSTPLDTGTDTEVHIGPGQQVQEVVARAAQRLRLEAVLEGPRAFINDRLVGVGETLSVKDGTTTCTFEVVRIQEDAVLVRCNGNEMTLKLAPTRDAVD